MQSTRSDRNLYHFLTRWRLVGTCQEVSDLLEDTERISQWWPSVYREVRIVRAGGLHSLGKVLDVVTKGVLPYALDGAFVNITYDWLVRASHPFIRRFGVIMRPLFVASHNRAMCDGERGLRRELAQLHAALRPFDKLRAS